MVDKAMKSNEEMGVDEGDPTQVQLEAFTKSLGTSLSKGKQDRPEEQEYEQQKTNNQTCKGKRKRKR